MNAFFAVSVWTFLPSRPNALGRYRLGIYARDLCVHLSRSTSSQYTGRSTSFANSGIESMVALGLRSSEASCGIWGRRL